MLRRLRDFEKWDVFSNDEHDLGTIEDAYFDDERWTVRYFVVRTGTWLTGRSVLLSPMAIGRVRPETARFEFRLTPGQIKNAPSVDLARPVSRQWEARYAGYYGFPPYWVGPTVWGPGAFQADAHAPRESPPRETDDDQHLRSAKEVSGYHIQARDGEIGHVEDFLVADDTWTIRYLLVDTSNWIGGRPVIIEPDSANRIDWARRQLHVDVSRQTVKDGPEFEPGGILATGVHERPVRLI